MSSRPGLLPRVFCGALGRAAALFHRVEVRGGPIPDGPVLVTANHLNSLLDPLILFRVAGRPTRPLAKAPLFDQLLVGSVLRGMGGLPVYRRQDDPEQMHRNEDTFRAAIEALCAGDALQIYPEGKSHSEPALEPIKTGAARIALAAEAGLARERRAARLGAGAAEGGSAAPETGSGVLIVPVGLTYERKHLFRGRALAEIGEPFPVASWLDNYFTDEQEAVRRLTDAIGEHLREVTLNLTRIEDRPLIEAAERIYTREKGLHGWREREGLGPRVPRLRRFAEALAWLRADDSPRYERLATEVETLDRLTRAFGVREGDVPPRYRPVEVARYALREGFALLVGLPFAALGTVVWYPTWIAPRWVVPRVNPGHEGIATYKLATGLVAVPLTTLAAGALGWWIAGWIGALIGIVGTPLLGLLALAWRERWARVREDAILFLRVLTRRRARDRLAARRKALVTEFDRVAEEMERETGE